MAADKSRDEEFNRSLQESFNKLYWPVSKWGFWS